MCYYNRPNLVRFALNSVKQQKFKNWEIAFVDDGSDVSAREAISEILGDEAHKLTYYNTNHTKTEKNAHGGSLFGLYWTLACQETKANIGIMLCDDDALVPGYLQKIDDFFSVKNPNWCYSHFLGYDPYQQKDFDEIIITERARPLTSDCNPDSILDASQVAFSLKAFQNNDVEFAFPCTANLDSDLYRKLFPLYGPCIFMGCEGQYKGLAKNNLTYRQLVDSDAMYNSNIDVNITPFKTELK